MTSHNSYSIVVKARTESNLNLVHDYIQHNPDCTQRDILTFTDISKHVVELYYKHRRINAEQANFD